MIDEYAFSWSDSTTFGPGICIEVRGELNGKKQLLTRVYTNKEDIPTVCREWVESAHRMQTLMKEIEDQTK